MRLVSIKESIFSKYIIHEINRPYGNFYLFDSCVVSEINEGVVFSSLEALDIFTYLTEFYNGIKRPRHFVYISNRINCYSVKPVDWLNYKFMERYMIAYGVVDNRDRAQEHIAFEKQFMFCSLELFQDLDTAGRWGVEVHQSFRLN